MECAQRYITARWARRDARRMAEALGTLGDVVQNPLAEKLMSSPLQVTFMVTVVFASGKPSESRWQLFNDYYRIIYERELQKAVRPFDVILNEHRQNIEAIHHRTGFVLQWRAESTGGTQADMTTEEFKSIVRACLEEDGLEAEVLERYIALIVGAARQRLVFLTSKSVDRLTFDIRSLQECMAAAALTNDDSVVGIKRIRAIAHSSYWRNTLLFAVGRFFVEPHLRTHREGIRILCEDLNREEPSRAAVRMGSRLALEILESGIVGSVPLIRRSLVALALKLLALPWTDDDTIAYRLAEVCLPEMYDEYKDALTLHLNQRSIEAAISAWLLALYLERRGIDWAIELVRVKWPADATEQATVSSAWIGNSARVLRDGNPLRHPDCQRLSESLPLLTPEALDAESWGYVRNVDFSIPNWLRLGARLHSQWHSQSNRSEMLVTIDGLHSGLGCHCTSIRNDPDEVAVDGARALAEEPFHAGWKIVAAVAEFMNGPNSQILGSCLRTIAEYGVPSEWQQWSRRAPWPLAACLGSADSKDNLLQLSTDAAEGRCGDFGDWCAREDSWVRDGVTLEELSGALFKSQACLGAAIGGYSYELSLSKSHEKALPGLQRVLAAVNEPKGKTVLAGLLVTFAQFSRGWSRMDPTLLVDHLLPWKRRWAPTEMILRPEDALGKEDEWMRLLNAVGMADGLKFVRTRWRLDEAPLEWILGEFAKDARRTGLLRLAAMWCAAGRSPTKRGASEIDPSSLSGKREQLAAALVALSYGSFEVQEAQELAVQLPRLLEEGADLDSCNMLVSAIENHVHTQPVLEELLRAVQSLPRVSRDLRGRMEWLRDASLQSSRSGLDREALQSLGLPYVPTDRN